MTKLTLIRNAIQALQRAYDLAQREGCEEEALKAVRDGHDSSQRALHLMIEEKVQKEGLRP